MSELEIKSYGSWVSPITSNLIVSETVRLGQVVLDNESTYWTEGRPQEGGRNVIVHCTADGQKNDVTPEPFNVRSRVHEYGGGAFAVVDKTVYFSNYLDNQIYRQEMGSRPVAITSESGRRHADFVINQKQNRLVCVSEDHSDLSRNEPVNSLVSLDLVDGTTQAIAFGNDFYASPCISRDESHLAWLTWNHPNMPWDGTELWVATWNEDGSIANPKQIAGGHNESIFQPKWSPDHKLYFVSDRNGWWNLHHLQNGQTEPLLEMEAEFGRPQWVFGMSTYGFASAEQIICAYTQNGIWHLASVQTETRKLERIETVYTSIESIQVNANMVVFIGGSPSQFSSVAKLDLVTQHPYIIRRSCNVEVGPKVLSTPQTIEFPTVNGLISYAFFYAPQNDCQIASESELPPLIVVSHGGPTGATSNTLSLNLQYWTSRGFAVLDVNYGGSTGYGRVYRERLNNQWGIVDVEDCINGAKFLVDQGQVDSNRIAIKGGSAGGYTTLCSLTYHDFFKAGASYYGIGNLEALATDTHKFESRYLDGLVGRYPEEMEVYRERSPIYAIDLLNCPIIIFQGLDDKVVPPNQAEAMVHALKTKGIPVAYIPFDGEGHGFRKSQNIKRALDAELYFYGSVFGFKPADSLIPIEITNMPT
ncbi:TPA: S9 family peptidase [Candidatus Poribacteria bacterium]|nr:S9 family peptidase [Candidatus Poribacteria bacterium]HIB98190.1 S9 family peptidase [Candidatus Poribacteria bacterium]HIN27732.1 S9 family peptidase [Candidatus Poribacteria bacterium]HIO82170.1 S9 family peptidase [Candidatus Poribacteria bacterium]